jgi:hypothetical protein
MGETKTRILGFFKIARAKSTRRISPFERLKSEKALNKKLGIPERIEAIIPDDIPELARHAEKEANPLYPVPKLMTAKELEKIYHLVK